MKSLFTNQKPLIGMIHLPALPGYNAHPGMPKVIEHALADLQTLQFAGFDAVLIENDNDQPHQIGVSKEIEAAFLKVMQALTAAAKIPVGMEIIYDAMATLRVAHAAKADFVRLDVFADTVETQWGTVPAQAAELAAYKRSLGASKLAFWADVHVKHATLQTPQKTLAASTKETANAGADVLIVTGDWTGLPPSTADCHAMHAAAPDVPIVIGSGLTATNASKLLAITDGAIVGTSIKTDGHVDTAKAAQLVRLRDSLRTN